MSRAHINYTELTELEEMHQKNYRFFGAPSSYLPETMISKTLGLPFIHTTKVAAFNTSYNIHDDVIPITPNTKKESPYLVTFINLHSYLLFFPFRIVWSNELESYIASTSLLRKVHNSIFNMRKCSSL